MYKVVGTIKSNHEIAGVSPNLNTFIAPPDRAKQPIHIVDDILFHHRLSHFFRSLLIYYILNESIAKRFKKLNFHIKILTA